MKKNVKNLISIILVAAMVIGSLAGCSNQTAQAPAADTKSNSLKAGTYTATAKGKNGEIKVEVAFDDTSITAVKILEHTETAGICEAPIEKIPAQILENQSIMVDGVSGATMTGNAIIEAVKDCIAQAGGKVEDFSAVKESEAKAEEVYDAQLAIVGAGAAGLMAAMSASEQGINVIVLEKAATIGSSNGAVAGGPSTSSNKVQEAEGEGVSADKLFDYMYNYSQGTVNSLLLRKAINAGGPLIDKLLDMGLEATLLPDNYGVGFRARIRLTVKGEGRFKMVQNFVEEKGGKFLFETTGEHVITNEEGKVIGVTGTKADGTPIKVNADAVLLATGGYLGNKEMLAEHFGNVGIVPLGNTLSTGDGINMALEAGGELEKNSFSLIFNEFAGENEKSEGWRKNDNLKYAIYGGLLVNDEGTRFMNEEVMATRPLAGGEEILRQGYFYSVIDEEYFNAMSEKGIWEYLGKPEDWYVGKMTQEGKVLKAVGERFDAAVKEGWAYKADTIEELAKYFELENLPETVKEYNAMCEAGVDSTFGKSNYFLKSIGEGPYYVFQYQSSAWGTLGGVKVDDKLRVINADFKPIPGLYAAGVDAGSLFTTPYYGNEGAALGLSLSSGNVAGTEISEYIKNLK